MSSMKKALAMTMMMAAFAGQDGLGFKAASEKSEVEKRVEEQLRDKRKPDKYPDIELTPKEKRKCKSWEQIQEAKRLKHEAIMKA